MKLPFEGAMENVVRSMFVISDLHLGGRAASVTDRGFQMMTHARELAEFVQKLAERPAASVELVINGDFVDFLAEESEMPGEWVPLIERPRRAAELLRQIATAENSTFRPVFTALGRLVHAGQQLTILLGNHDIELSYPEVRRELERAFTVEEGHGFRFIRDGEAYRRGDVLIEHGNRYDAFNIVDHDGLRRRRSLQSRGQDARDDGLLPPVGSRMVAEVMNPIKTIYPFVDLLKPETGAVIPILLALEPGYRKKLAKIASVLFPAVTHVPNPFIGADAPIRLSEVAGVGESNFVSRDKSTSAPADPLARVLGDVFGSRAVADDFLCKIDEEARVAELTAPLAEVSARGTATFLSGVLSLLTARASEELERRLPALLKALQVLQDDKSFVLGVDSTAYVKAARQLAERTGVHYVVFGHTHLARDIDLGDGRRYLNTGTWTNLLCLPPAIFGPRDEALKVLRGWVENLRQGSYQTWFRPTFARLDFDAHERIVKARVVESADPT